MTKTCWMVLMAGAIAMAQEAPKGDVMFHREVVVQTGQGPGTGVMMSGHDATMRYVSTEMMLGGKAVKGAPYSAQAVTETTQTLADGNRIHRKTTSMIYRDGEGRTRREEALGSVGPFVAGADMPQIVMINDPAAGVNYVLNSKERTAHKMVLPKWTPAGGGAVAGGFAGSIGARGETHVMTFHTAPEGAAMSVSTGVNQAATESLGRQTINGIEADGTRTTITIPAGEIGNDQPIQIVSERWYSPELQTVVMSKNSDPRMGETVYQLSNINRAEPSPMLFQVPADYTVKDDKAMIQTFEKRVEQK